MLCVKFNLAHQHLKWRKTMSEFEREPSNEVTMDSIKELQKKGIAFGLTKFTATVTVPENLRGEVGEDFLRECVDYLYQKDFKGRPHSNPINIAYRAEK